MPFSAITFALAVRRDGVEGGSSRRPAPTLPHRRGEHDEEKRNRVAPAALATDAK